MDDYEIIVASKSSLGPIGSIYDDHLDLSIDTSSNDVKDLIVELQISINTNTNTIKLLKILRTKFSKCYKDATRIMCACTMFFYFSLQLLCVLHYWIFYISKQSIANKFFNKTMNSYDPTCTWHYHNPLDHCKCALSLTSLYYPFFSRAASITPLK